MRILLLSFGENGLELLESLGSDGMEMDWKLKGGPIKQAVTIDLSLAALTLAPRPLTEMWSTLWGAC